MNTTQRYYSEEPLKESNEYLGALKMSTQELFNLPDISNDKIISEFSKQFDSLKQERINKEKYDINVAFEEKKINKTESTSLINRLHKLGIFFIDLLMSNIE